MKNKFNQKMTFAKDNAQNLILFIDENGKKFAYSETAVSPFTTEEERQNRVDEFMNGDFDTSNDGWCSLINFSEIEIESYDEDIELS